MPLPTAIQGEPLRGSSGVRQGTTFDLQGAMATVDLCPSFRGVRHGIIFDLLNTLLEPWESKKLGDLTHPSGEPIFLD